MLELAQAAHWAIALVPVLAMLTIFVWLDAFKLMSLGEVLLLLLFGGIAAIVAYPISGRFLDTLPIGFTIYSRFIAPWIEEALKAIVMIALFRFNRIGYKLDAVISGFAIGAGFSVVENVIYLTIFPFYGAGTDRDQFVDLLARRADPSCPRRSIRLPGIGTRCCSALSERSLADSC
jgi:RsiW-degrading membrane proteinase PrsW (M82 family)